VDRVTSASNANAAVRKLAAAHQSGRAPLILWYLFVPERWMRDERAGGRVSFNSAAACCAAIS
jgi:hypothetical protein